MHNISFPEISGVWSDTIVGYKRERVFTATLAVLLQSAFHYNLTVLLLLGRFDTL